MIKKTFAVLLACILSLCILTACSSGNEPAATPGTDASAAAGSTAAPENTGETYTLRIGAGTGGVHNHNIWMEAYKEAIEEATGGQIVVELYPAGQLGNLAELIQGLRDGTVDSAVIPTTYFATTFPTAAVVDLSFMFESSAQLYHVLADNDTLYEQTFIDNGIQPVAWLRAVERNIISSKKIESMDNLQGLKMWSMPSPVIQKEVELLGCVTSNLDVGELAPSMQNGTVDAAISDIALYNSQSLHTSAPYFLEAPGDALVSIFAVNPAWLSKLPADLQETMETVAKKVVEEVEKVPRVEIEFKHIGRLATTR